MIAVPYCVSRIATTSQHPRRDMRWSLVSYPRKDITAAGVFKYQFRIRIKVGGIGVLTRVGTQRQGRSFVMEYLIY